MEEVLTPPPDIDTSGWLTYRDETNGFELKYPPDATVKRNFRRTGPGAAGTGSEIDLVVGPGTRLYDKYLFITARDSVSPTDCQPPELSSVKPGGAFGPKRLLGRDAVFWRSEKPGGMMMHFIHDWVYMTLVRNTCLTITGGLYGISPGVLEPDLLPVDYKKESQMFTAMLTTFRWLN